MISIPSRGARKINNIIRLYNLIDLISSHLIFRLNSYPIEAGVLFDALDRSTLLPSSPQVTTTSVPKAGCPLNRLGL